MNKQTESYTVLTDRKDPESFLYETFNSFEEAYEYALSNLSPDLDWGIFKD